MRETGEVRLNRFFVEWEELAPGLLGVRPATYYGRAPSRLARPGALPAERVHVLAAHEQGPEEGEFDRRGRTVVDYVGGVLLTGLGEEGRLPWLGDLLPTRLIEPEQ